MNDDWMTPEHKAAALEGFMGNEVAKAYARMVAATERPASPDLAAWLLEQIAEDERVASANALDLWPGDTLQMVAETKTPYAWQPHDVSPQRIAHILRFNPRWVLAECDAKRRTIGAIFDYEARIDGEWGCCHDADQIQAGKCPERRPDDVRALRLLALPYSDRPGYREEWTP